MNKQIIKESIIVLGLASLLGFSIFTQMPSMAFFIIQSVLLLLFSVFAIFIWTSKPEDERAASYKGKASDLSFLAGGLFLTIGIAYQSYTSHVVDYWMVATLFVITAVRLGAQMWLIRK